MCSATYNCLTNILLSAFPEFGHVDQVFCLADSRCVYFVGLSSGGDLECVFSLDVLAGLAAYAVTGAIPIKLSIFCDGFQLCPHQQTSDVVRCSFRIFHVISDGCILASLERYNV